MARELYTFEVTIPSGTSASAPYRESMTIPVRIVDTMEIVVPPGPSGFLGFAVTMSGINVLPTRPDTWVVADDERITWPLSGLPDSGAWQLSGYNGDVFDHTVYVRFLVDLVGAATPTSFMDSATAADLSYP